MIKAYTNIDILKALETCSPEYACFGCPHEDVKGGGCHTLLHKDAAELIRRLIADTEKMVDDALEGTGSLRITLFESMDENKRLKEENAKLVEENAKLAKRAKELDTFIHEIGWRTTTQPFEIGDICAHTLPRK